MIAIPGVPGNKETDRLSQRGAGQKLLSAGLSGVMPVNLFSLLAYDNFLIFIVNPPDGINLKSKTDFDETLLRLISTLPSLPS